MGAEAERRLNRLPYKQQDTDSRSVVSERQATELRTPSTALCLEELPQSSDGISPASHFSADRVQKLPRGTHRRLHDGHQGDHPDSQRSARACCWEVDDHLSADDQEGHLLERKRLSSTCLGFFLHGCTMPCAVCLLC